MRCKDTTWGFPQISLDYILVSLSYVSQRESRRQRESQRSLFNGFFVRIVLMSGIRSKEHRSARESRATSKLSHFIFILLRITFNPQKPEMPVSLHDTMVLKFYEPWYMRHVNLYEFVSIFISEAS